MHKFDLFPSHDEDAYLRFRKTDKDYRRKVNANPNLVIRGMGRQYQPRVLDPVPEPFSRAAGEAHDGAFAYSAVSFHEPGREITEPQPYIPAAESVEYRPMTGASPGRKLTRAGA